MNFTSYKKNNFNINIDNKFPTYIIDENLYFMSLENEKNNLLVIELFKNQKKVLIPFVEEIVPLLDIKNNFLIINPPNGLLEL